MPWQLTTPVDTGALDTNDYDQVKVTGYRFDTERGFMLIELQYGRTVAGVWTPGITPAGKQSSVMMDGQAFLDFIAANQATYAAVKTALYGWLSTNTHIAAGSVV